MATSRTSAFKPVAGPGLTYAAAVSPLAGVRKETKAPMIAHVFIDNSNILYGARALHPDIRIDAERLVVLVETSKRQICQRVVVGSNMPEILVRKYTNKRYAVYSDAARPDRSESLVDTALHSAISALLMDAFMARTPPQQLVLCTGDGREGGPLNNFVKLASFACAMGWSVEVWSWTKQLSAEFLKLEDKFPALVKIKFLEPHLREIGFRTESCQDAIAVVRIQQRAETSVSPS
jgi:hypothetical protein